MEQVYCTLILTDGYLPGAQVLAHSLRDGGTTRKLVVLIPEEGLSEATITELERLYDYVIKVSRLANREPANLMLLGRLELAQTFTKIKLWSLVQFSKIIYLDADVLALGAPDELFDTEADFAACPDVGWPDCFNSGVMVLTPNMGTYSALLNLAERGLSFDGADQGLLNMHFRSWHRLSFTYNVTPSASYQYTPAYHHYGSNIRMVHFIGANKPWLQSRPSGSSQHPASYGDLLSRWWATWDLHYRSLSEQNPAGKTNSGAPFSFQFGQNQQQQPAGYDPNFRRNHSTYDNAPPSGPTTWQPPPKVSEKKEQPQGSQSPPGKQAYKPPVFQTMEEENWGKPYVPPIYLPKEAVPYVPREMPYSMYSQTKVPDTVYHSHEEYNKQGMQQAAQSTTPPPQQQQTSYTANRRFSADDIQERVDKDLPFPPPLVASEEKDDAEDSHEPIFARSQEAKNFPTHTYEWNTSTEETPFVPPKLSSPPKNLNYQLPAKAPTGPTRVFPWEKEATRTGGGSPLVDPESPVDVKIVSEDDWTSYSLVNAWDNDPDIGRYVETFQSYLPGRRSGTATPKQAFRIADLDVRDGAVQGKTDIIPPALPVTPNPVRSMRGSWQANVLNDESKYPSAKGIPSQEEWDPAQQLEELKNAPAMLLKKSPPSPNNLGLGSPRSPGEVLVSSSVPVPQLPHMITAQIEEHRRASLLAHQQQTGEPPTHEDFSLRAGTALPPGAIRPIAMRSASTQTEGPDVEDKAVQWCEEDFARAESNVANQPVELASA